MDNGFKAAGVHPAAQLLVDQRPRRQIMRHQPPVRATLHDVAHAVEDLAQRVFPLPCVFRQQGQIGGDEGPFLIAHIRRVGGASTHARILSPSQGRVPNNL